MRTITLELLRHGPAHNQLLSPLTPYLALCENHGAVTIHVPFEHNQFLHRLSSLSYRVREEESRLFQLQDTAKVMGDIFSAIPGLTAESSKADDGDGDQDRLTHLRLIISASELALLPFELALSPNGFPGAGQHLLLQPQMPVIMTREVRRVPGEQLQWPRRPRILFVAAAPPGTPQAPGVGAIPLEAHLLALRRVIAPWIKFFDADDEGARQRRIAEHLVLLPAASIEAVERECATGKYTHVHILAHGVEQKEGFDRRFYLAMHDALDPEKPDFISGARLATALRAAQRPDSRGLARPAVVSLASCDSGNVGSVAGAGASIAHALHEAGIPVVVAGQFPLSFGGSVRLTELLYGGLLWGADPRPLLHDLRRRLYAQFRETHDWASLTAYVTLPPDFEEQLSGIQISQAMRSINAAMNHVDEATRRFFEQLRSKRSKKSPPPGTTDEKNRQLVESAWEKIREAKARLQRLLERIPAERSHIYGLIASTEKREAEIHYSATKVGEVQAGEGAERLADSMEQLQTARDHYWESYVLKSSNSWAVVQYLSLALVLGRRKPGPDAPAPAAHGPAPKVRPEKNLDSLWSLARMLSIYDLQTQGREVPSEALRQRRSAAEFLRQQRALAIWAHGNLLELYLLALIMDDYPDRPNGKEAERLALEHADSLIDLSGRDSFEVYSTRRQIFRYIEWFREIADIEAMIPVAQQVFQKFPEEVEESWK
jgi:hypothetical protein